ncbi:MAG: hypothetical protein KAW16_02745 [candidate division Zixibacteria bacterium]|nr:hypothetical protein [candidate division Zixibacteria bacterium]
MGRLVGKESYDEIIKQLDNVERWFKSLRIGFSGSRFDTYRRNIEILNKYHQEGRIKEFIELRDFKEIVFSLAESSEFSIIYQQLKDVDSKFLRKRLRMVAQGPLMIDREEPTKSTGQPRDYLFELNIIAHLKAAGFQVVFDSYSDAHCLFESKHVLFECKRPQTRNSVQENFLKAKKQLTDSLNKLSKPDSKGIIAISIGKILNKGQMFLVGRNEAAMDAKLDLEMKKAWDDFEHLERKVLDTRIIGIFLLLNTPAVIDDMKLLTDVQEARVAPTCLKNSADFHFLKRMIADLDRFGSGKTNL